jgi:4a-hydroxytetrahydrobiopterin dehydratase
MTLLSDAEIDDRLSDLGGWERGEDASIVRELKFADFAAAIAFVNAVAAVAEAANHHPRHARTRLEQGAPDAQHALAGGPD